MLAAAGRKGCSEGDSKGEKPQAESHTPILYYELQTALKSLMKHLNLPLHQVMLSVKDSECASVNKPFYKPLAYQGDKAVSMFQE